jgi:hypothetical protein
MIHEIDIYGVFLPDLLIWFVIAFLVSVPVRRLLGFVGFYRLVWHRALFDTALFVILLGGVIAASHRVLS